MRVKNKCIVLAACFLPLLCLLSIVTFSQKKETPIKKIYLLFSLALMFLLAACTDKPEIPVSLKGKWTLESIVTNQYNNGALTNTTTEPGNGTTYNFKSDGILLILSPFGSNHPYTIISVSKVEIDGDIFEISSFTGTQAILFIRKDFVNQYQLMFINLKR